MNRREFMKRTGIAVVSLPLCKEVVPVQGLTLAKLLSCKKSLEDAKKGASAKVRNCGFYVHGRLWNEALIVNPGPSYIFVSNNNRDYAYFNHVGDWSQAYKRYDCNEPDVYIDCEQKLCRSTEDINGPEVKHEQTTIS